MKDKLRVIMKEDFELELNALAVCVTVLKPLSWDQHWRVFNYLLVRFLGRGWILNKPQSE